MEQSDQTQAVNDYKYPSDAFDDVFPFYLLCGMTYEQFWYGDSYLVVYYREAHKLRIEQRNQELWLQGLYNYNAMLVAIGNSFSKQKQKYINKPIPLFKPSEEERKRQIAENNRKLVERLNRFKDEFEKKQKTGAK